MLKIALIFALGLTSVLSMNMMTIESNIIENNIDIIQKTSNNL